MIASFPPITFCLKTGFALILDTRPASLGSVPPALALGGQRFLALILILVQS